MSIKILFDPRDLWIGVYWDKVGYVTRIFVCIIPCLPILFEWRED